MDIRREYFYVNCALTLVFLALALLPFALRIRAGVVEDALLHLPAPACFVQQETGQPCPSCGLTRSVVALYQGDWRGSLGFHHLGPAFVALMVLELLLRMAPFLSTAKLVPWLDMLQLFCAGVAVRLLL